jgi:hypothetical protein
VYYQSLPQMGKFAAKVDQTSLRAEPEGQGIIPA